MKLVFKGIVELGDSSRVSEEEGDLNGSVHVGGVDVVEAVDEAVFDGKVTVAVADERFEGPLSVECGWGYSEYTPVDDDKLTVGPHDIIRVLGRYEGQEITLFIADEPINVLEDIAG